MALILVRGESEANIYNSLKILENKLYFKLITKPILVDSVVADSVVEDILSSKVKRQSKLAVAFFVEESISLSIVKIKKTRLPSHVVVSSRFSSYSRLAHKIINGEVFNKFSPSKLINDGIMDYSIDKKEKQFIKNNKINSYIK